MRNTKTLGTVTICRKSNGLTDKLHKSDPRKFIVVAHKMQPHYTRPSLSTHTLTRIRFLFLLPFLPCSRIVDKLYHIRDTFNRPLLRSNTIEIISTVYFLRAFVREKLHSFVFISFRINPSVYIYYILFFKNENFFNLDMCRSF